MVLASTPKSHNSRLLQRCCASSVPKSSFQNTVFCQMTICFHRWCSSLPFLGFLAPDPHYQYPTQVSQPLLCTLGCGSGRRGEVHEIGVFPSRSSKWQAVEVSRSGKIWDIQKISPPFLPHWPNCLTPTSFGECLAKGLKTPFKKQFIFARNITYLIIDGILIPYTYLSLSFFLTASPSWCETLGGKSCGLFFFFNVYCPEYSVAYRSSQQTLHEGPMTNKGYSMIILSGTYR